MDDTLTGGARLVSAVPAALIDDLNADLECEELLDCVWGLGDLDEASFRLLVEEGELTIDAVADRLDCGRTTAYRSMRRLHDAGLVEQRVRTVEGGGRYHVYRAVDPNEIADRMLRLLNDWYAQTGQLVNEFRETYA